MIRHQKRNNEQKKKLSEIEKAHESKMRTFLRKRRPNGFSHDCMIPG